MKTFLPLGSIVTLKKGNKKLMICGRVQVYEENQKTYDYCACMYPQGIINPNELYLFNNDDIDIIYFVGMQDSEEFAFREYMNEKLKEM